MKKLLALLLALVMLTGCTLALAAGSPTGSDSGVSTGTGTYDVVDNTDDVADEEVTSEDAEVSVVMLDAAELSLPEGVKAENVIAFEVETDVKEKLALTVPGLTASKKIYIAVVGEDGENTFVELDAKYFEMDGEALTLKLADIVKDYKLPATLQIVVC